MHDHRPRETDKQAKAIQDGLVASLKYASFFSKYTIKTDWSLAICDSLMLRGELSAARAVLAQHSTVPIVGLDSTYTGKWQLALEAGSLDQLKVDVRYVILDILEGRELAAFNRMKSLQSDTPESLYSLGGLNGSLQSLLNGFYQQHFGGNDPALNFCLGLKLPKMAVVGIPRALLVKMPFGNVIFLRY